MPTYEKAKAELNRRVAGVMEKYHSHLAAVGVTVDTLLAHATTDEEGEPIGDAIRHHGRKANAKIRIVSLKDRVLGHADAEMIIDGDQFDMWGDQQIEALIDHELTHLELAVDGDGNLKRDDHERPKLKMRPHDREFGWFDEVARRHPKDSFEVTQASEMFENRDFRQLYLRGMEEDERPIMRQEKSRGRKAASIA